jgi:hypothetical protein
MKPLAFAYILLSLTCAAVCLADQFDDAEHLFNKFMDRNAALRKLKVDESRDLVKALCEAEESERARVAQDAGERIKNDVNNGMGELTDLEKETREALDKVLADDNFKSKQERAYEKAQEYKEKLESTWASLLKISESVRGSNNPVGAYMLRAGQEAHYGYQRNSSNCTVYEFRLSNGQADCINLSSCEVIEIKPNNSRSISVGKDQAGRYVKVLNEGGRDFEGLVSKDRDFEKCKSRFRIRVALYTFCPEIDDEGRTRSTSVGWTFED